MRPMRQPKRGVVGAAVALAAWGGLALLGCDSSAPATGPSGQYSLAVTITAPTGVTPNVTVRGPAGYQRTLTATGTLTGIQPGSYTVTAGAVKVAHPIAPTVYEGTVTGGSVVLGPVTTAAASVTYGVRAGSGALWVGNVGLSGSTLVSYSAAQLAASTSAAPAITIVPTPTVAPAGVAVDAQGVLWAATNDNQATNTGTGVGFLASQIQGAVSNPGAPAFPGFSLTVTSGAHEFLQGVAVDAGGNLWITNFTAGTIVEFTSTQFGVQVSPTPAVTLSTIGGSLSGPAGLAFDLNGNLWAANSSGNTVVEFTASQLTASGSPAPAVVLSATSGSLDGPSNLAFDASGNLWVANTNANTVVKFTAGQLLASGSPTPAVTLSGTGGSLNSPSGLALDASGDLWVANAGAGTVVEFGASQLAATGAPAPVVTISGSALSGPHGLAFDPPPSPPNPWDY